MSRGTQSTVEQAPILGETVGRHRIIGALGDGRLGRLYVAEQNEIRGVPKIIALRNIRPELGRSPRFRARFQEAVRVATRCDHPNLVSLFELGDADLGRANGGYFIGMEYLPSENVESILRRCRSGEAMPADIAAYVVKQVAAVLQCLRDLREASSQRTGTAPDVFHDAVDPSNVFVTYYGTVKWLAVGLRASNETNALDIDVSRSADVSRAANDDRPLARAETDVDSQRRADVASLGRLLGTCLVGEEPFASAATFDAPGLLARLGRLPVGVRDALSSVVRRALSLDPRERFESPGAMADELDRYLFLRPSRPTPRHLRRWLEQLFGAERALLQMRVARGRDVQAALSHLGAALPTGGQVKSVRSFSSPRPRELWLTRHATFSQFGRASIAIPRSFDWATGAAPDVLSRVSVIPVQHPSLGLEAPPSTLGSAELPTRSGPRERSSRAAWAVATLAACSVLALVALMLLPQPHAEPRPGAPAQGAVAASVSGGVSVRSTPDGAAVFIDGEPTGLSTPVVVRGLPAGRTLRMRVEKAGFGSREQSIDILGGSVVERLFELSASTGQVRFTGAPADARIYVDDQAVGSPEVGTVELSVGSHAVRVETQSVLLFSGTVDVVSGEQTIQLGGERGP